MQTTMLDFFLETQNFPFNARVVCLDLQVMELIEQLHPLTMVLVWSLVVGLESLQVVQVIVPPLKVVVVLAWCVMSGLLGWEVFLAYASFL